MKCKQNFLFLALLQPGRRYSGDRVGARAGASTRAGASWASARACADA